MQTAAQDAADQEMGDESKENALDPGQSMRLKERHAGRRNSITNTETDAAPQMSKLWGMLGALEGEHQSMNSRRDSLVASRSSVSLSASFEGQPRMPQPQPAVAAQPTSSLLPPRHAVPAFCPVPTSTTTSRPGTAPAAAAAAHLSQHQQHLSEPPLMSQQMGVSSRPSEQVRSSSSNLQMQKLHDMFGTLEGKMQQMTSQGALHPRHDQQSSRPATCPAPQQPSATAHSRPTTLSNASATIPAAAATVASAAAAAPSGSQQQHQHFGSVPTLVQDAKRTQVQFSVPIHERTTSTTSGSSNPVLPYIPNHRYSQPQVVAAKPPALPQHTAATATAAVPVAYARPQPVSALQACVQQASALQAPAAQQGPGSHTHMHSTDFHGSAAGGASITGSLCDAAAADIDGAVARDEKEVAVQLPAGHMASRVGQAAAELINDAVFLKLADEALNAQLQRTKDGATDKSRIQELAALVKLLRRCVRELGSRTSLFVERSIKMEKEHMKQLEAVQLSSACSVKQLQAEIAVARQELAQNEAEVKGGKAQWGYDLEMQKSEVARLQRELERHTEERDKAREEGKRAEQERVQLLLELKDLRKAAHQSMREAAVSQSETVRLLTEDKIAADAKAGGLKDDNAKLSTRLRLAEECVADCEQERHVMHATVDRLRACLEASETCCKGQLEQLGQANAHLAESRASLTTSTAEGKSLAAELQGTAQQHASASSQLSVRLGELQSIQQRLKEVTAESVREKGVLAQELADVKASELHAVEERNALLGEKGALKAAVACTLERKEELEVALGLARQQHSTLEKEASNLRNQVEFHAGQEESSALEAAALKAALSKAEARVVAADAEMQEKDERLAMLDGEFMALKEVLGDSGDKDVLSSLLAKISMLQVAAGAAEANRRRLHNELVEVRGNVRVYCRVRASATPAVRCLSDNTSVAVMADGKEQNFGYDRVFGPAASQEEVFGCVSELVQSALDGYHVCLFSYGQTGAGKTYTMQGGEGPASRGIIPRAVQKILEAASKLEEQEWSYQFEASVLEVYNNMLHDLLEPGSGFIADQNAIKHDPTGGHTMVAGVTRVPIQDPAAASDLIRRSAAARAVESTAMNATSSRSHSVFMLYITGSHAPSGTQLQGCLCLVDLAGSERVQRSQAEEQRLKEACAINQSLSALGDVFSALSSKSGHIPYRNSKLTYLLQPCLGGHGKTLMLVNINPEAASVGESLCSLRFAAKVNGCEMGAKGAAPRRNVTTSGGGEDAASKRMSLPGAPRAGGAVGQVLDAAAAKRMSLAGAPKTAASSAGSSGAQAQAAGGAKRIAGSVLPPLPGNPAKRSRI